MILQFQVRGSGNGSPVLKVLQFLFKPVIESQVVVLFEVGDDFVGVKISILQFLVMAATLQGVAGANELGHFLVELRNTEWEDVYRRFSLERILSLWNSM
jgi:hypothetical protein